jgi:hypothetical protein
MAFWNVLQHLYSRYQKCMIIFCRKWSLNCYILFYFSEIKWFREYFEATAFYRLSLHGNAWHEIKSLLSVLAATCYHLYSSGYTFYLFILPCQFRHCHNLSIIALHCKPFLVSREKLLLASSSPSVYMYHVGSRLTDFWWNLTLGTCMQNFRENQNSG